MSDRLSSAERGVTPAALAATLHVSLIGDYVCPFCFVGKRMLDDALVAVQGPVEVDWHPYQLNPALPANGVPFGIFVTQRFGGLDAIAPALEHLTGLGRAVNIDFRFDRITHVPNTLPIHQVMQLAAARGLDQAALADDLLSAFFEQGRNIGDPIVLGDIASRHGLQGRDVDDAMGSESLRHIVRSREAQVRAGGLAGVPGYLLNRRLLVVGPRTTDTLVAAFDRAMFGAETNASLSPPRH